ncbi:CBS domain-containing protein [Comamonas testosteroni]|uniref:CBS domain-containing protein n=1 Tax=Comamonas testosteroni TaxID=285 RepID=A0A373FD67_COMTE|nr:HPP family protein [Comamonas testosteroni]RGE42076.1 CBS domain-containing protein [Comamonas testosteroni]
MSILQTLWQRLGPVTTRPSWRDLARSGIGAGLGLALASILVGLVDHFFPHTLFLFAPLGATAVLVFAVPSSPLAQPWNCVVGNTVSALYTLLLLWAFPWLSQTALAALAVAGAIALMLLTRSLHPPGGAVALLTVLGAAQMLPLGWHLLIPMAVLSGVLAAVGVLYHRACGRPYLHQPPQPAPAQAAPSRLALNAQDLKQLLQRFDQSYNLTPDDLGALLAAAEEDAIKRRFAAVRCAEVMSAKLLTIGAQTPLEEVADLFHRHLIKSLPVIDEQGRLIGRVLRADLFDWLWQGHRARQQQSLWQRLKPLRSTQSPSVAKDLMREPELCVQESTPVGDLLHELASHTVQFIAVQRGELLTGVITRSDVIRTLLSLNQ